MGPFYKNIPDPEKSFFWFSTNLHKRGITLNLETADGRELFKRLVRTADFVIESSEPGYMKSLGLGYEELEALRLADFNGMGQQEAAGHMKISRQSFGRVLQKARRTLAEGLIQGKIIRISGGSYKLIKKGRE